MDTSFCSEQLFTWLGKLLETCQYDKVICVERKATAILRALLDLKKGPQVGITWEKVLSSDGLNYLPHGWLDGQRILIFNEMIHKGKTTTQTIQKVLTNSPKINRIETAAFVLHEDFDIKADSASGFLLANENADAPDHVVHRGVPNRAYCSIRDSIVELLRDSGALLLDTEHLESVFQLRIPSREFVNILNCIGHPIEYENDAPDSNPGVTIRTPVVSDLERLRLQIPEGTDLTAQTTPQKLRVVRRDRNEFAFIPIWYPPISEASVLNCVALERLPDYLLPAIKQCPPSGRLSLVFHLTSLVAGLELLRSAWAALGPLVGDAIVPLVPKGSTAPGSSLGHLRALYPLLDFGALESSVALAIESYKDMSAVNRARDARGWKPNPRTVGQVDYVDAITRQENAKRLILSLVESRETFGVEEDFLMDGVDVARSAFTPFTWTEFWNRGEQLQIPPPVRTISMDWWIDNAIIKTTERIMLDQGQSTLVRGFEPDSEFTLRRRK